MSAPDKKTYRIWFKPGVKERFGLNYPLSTFSLKSKKWKDIPEGNRDQSFECRGIRFVWHNSIFSFDENESLPSEIELDLEKTEQGSTIVLFNNVPKILISYEGIPLECPSREIKALLCLKEDSPESISKLSNFAGIHLLVLDFKNSQKNLNFLTPLTNLKVLTLSSFDALTNFVGLSSLRNLKHFQLFGGGGKSLKNMKGLSNNRSLEFLYIQSISLASLDGLSGLTNLTSLRLISCFSLLNLDSLRDLKNLTSLDLKRCESLTEVGALSGLTNLTSLNLEGCSSLLNLNALSGLLNLRKLNLGRIRFRSPKDPLDLMPLEGLIHLRKLNLEFNATISSIDVISRFRNLSDLNLMDCENITNLDFLNGITNLEILLLSGCKSIENTDGLSESKNIRLLMLNNCQSLTDISGLRALKKLEVLTLENSPFVGNIDFLRDHPRLRKFTFIDPFKPVSILSATRRNDIEFVKNKANEWLEVARKAPEPETLVCDLSDTFGFYAKESWASDALFQLVDLMLARVGNAESTWASLLTAVAKCPNQQAQEILRMFIQSIDQERASSLLRPFLKTLADLPVSLSEWANERADELLESLSVDFLRDYGPSVCLFYARIGREDLLRSWLERLTDPETPRWRDRIHLSLGQWEIKRGDLDAPRARLKEMSQGSFKDELLEALARVLAKEKPLEAGELLDQISEEWRQATLSAELAEEPAFTDPAENAYRLLLHMERDSEKLADWVESLIQNNPESKLAHEVAGTFGPDGGVSPFPKLLSGLLDEELVAKATKDNQLKSFKEELMAEGEAENFLWEALIERMCRQDLVNEEEANELLENLRGEKQ